MNNQSRSLRTAAWLGWQLESNWTSPWLFALYVIFKPLCSSLLLVCMYFAARIATDGAVPVAFLPYLYISNACYMLVGAVAFGMSYAVVTDREHYRMLKYIYITPVHLQTYFVGRGLAGAAEATVGALINLTIGALCFSDVRHAFTAHDTEWGWLFVYLVIGLTMLVSLGLIMASILLNMARHGMFLSEGVAGMLYLLSGAVFPIAVLPLVLRWMSLGLPPTYWMEGMRRALLGPPANDSTMLHSPLTEWSHTELALALLISTFVMVVLSQVLFRWSERRAWRLGRIEETTGV